MVYSYTLKAARMAQSISVNKATGSQFAALREVRAYWEALRDDQDIPRREQINPRGMAGALHQVFMLERVASGVARFRLAGMSINDVMGMDVRGMPFSAMFDPTARARLVELLEKATATSTVLEMDLEADRGIGRPALRARLLMLPIKGAAGETDLVLGCLACDGQIGRTPRRFVIARALEEQLGMSANAPKMQLSESTSTAFAARKVVAMLPTKAEPITPKPAAAKPAIERPYLRLVRAED